MTAEKLQRVIGEIDSEYIVAAGERLGLLDEMGSSSKQTEETVNGRIIRKFSKTALIAAVIAAALAVTALAVVFQTKIQPTDGLTGSFNAKDGNHTVFFENAKLYMTFYSDAPRHEIMVKANWLPSEPTVGSLGVYTDYLSDDGEGPVLPYVINTYNRIDIQGIRYCFDGREKLIKQDEWKGFERTEIEVDYTGTPHGYDAANYLILFSPENNYLIYIGGTDSMETLEKIAENLEIKVGSEITELYDAGDDIAWFDLGRG